MRQASWEELFKQGAEEEAPKPSPWLRLSGSLRLISFEELITLLIVLTGFYTVVRSIDNADWVSEMPSLYTIGFLGLGVGLVFSHVRHLPGLVAHTLALAIGVVATLLTVSTELEGSYFTRIGDILDRVYVWGDALINGGISNDDLPFVVLVVAATYLAAYIAAWSVFRWYNAWIALIPGGLALLTNISYLPGQKSLPLLIYLFCAILLLARMNLLRQEREWRATGIKFPEHINLHVLNVTVWMGILLLAAAWVLPVGHGSGALYSLWIKVTEPVAGPARDLGRVFSAIDAKKGGSVHQFGSTLPLQGEISLGGSTVMEVSTSEPGFLRAQSYDVYTAQGWKVGPNSQITSGAWPALKPLQSPQDAANQLRRQISLQITTKKNANVIVSAGQPLSVNVDTRVVFGPAQGDVTSIRPSKKLDSGSQYRVDSTVSNASANALRAASASYSSALNPYLQLPDGLPQRVKDKAAEVAAGKTNPYDKATAIEQFLRGYAIDTEIAAAPPKQDSVDYFLFDAQAGYFDYHASAMVVMLRSLGIPARLAVGYVIHPEDRTPQTNVYTIRESNAFAWPEVYFPGMGWVEFNPTPSEPPVLRSGVDGDFFPGSDPSQEFFDDAFFLPSDATGVQSAPAALDSLAQDDGSNVVSRVIISIIVVLLAVTAVAFLVFHYSWQHGLRSYAYPVQIWEKTLRLSRWSKIKPLPQETPREVVARLKKQLPEVDDLDYLEESYVRTRYGNKELSEQERERLTQVWMKARNNLLARVLRWR
jgi:transglutaminase-like putative cysteine protease